MVEIYFSKSVSIELSNNNKQTNDNADDDDDDDDKYDRESVNL